MKKFFSLIAAVLFAGSMFAAEITISPADLKAAESAEVSQIVSGMKLTITKGTINDEQIRIFKNETFALQANVNITKIVFTCTANNTTKYGPGCFAEQEGYSFEGKVGTWEGSAKKVEFLAESNQVRATEIVVTLDGDPTENPIEGGGDEGETIVLEMNDGFVDNEYYEDYGSSDLILFNIPTDDEGYLDGDGDYLDISLFPADPNNIAGTYSGENEALDLDYSFLMRINGTDTTEIAFTDGEVVIEVAEISKEDYTAQVTVSATLTGEDGNIYTVSGSYLLYYDFIDQEEGIEETLAEGKAVKVVRNGVVIIRQGDKNFSVLGQSIK